MTSTQTDALFDRTRRSDWWHDAVVYEVYLRSFADGNGDGTGDLAGLRRKLGYIRDLGVDAIWLTPWYPSPMKDGGYDVADYRDIDPSFGSLDDAARLFAEAHAAGLRVLIDMVANHTSDAHPWFQAALRAGPGAGERQRYYFRDGKGAAGGEPPNDWRSAFGGPAWTRVREADGGYGQWYLHLFAPEQPDLNWSCPDIWAEFESITRFWFDLGADGLRLDAVPAMGKHPDLPDAGFEPEEEFGQDPWPKAPYWGGESVHGILRAWRAVAQSYAPERVLIGEVSVDGPQRLVQYLRPDELHSAFTFELPRTPWDESAMRKCVDGIISSLVEGAGQPTWVLSSHDEVRTVTRYARQAEDLASRTVLSKEALRVGTRRARAAALVMLALPGAACLYQGEELGLWEVEDLPREVLADPIVARTGDPSKGRDGCRVPFPWDGERPPFGFSVQARTWLPQPLAWAQFTVAAQEKTPDSDLELYRRALALRRVLGVSANAFSWLDHGPEILAFRRGKNFRCVVNFGSAPFPLPKGARLLLASSPVLEDALPPDAAVWLWSGADGLEEVPGGP